MYSVKGYARKTSCFEKEIGPGCAYRNKAKHPSNHVGGLENKGGKLFVCQFLTSNT